MSTDSAHAGWRPRFTIRELLMLVLLVALALGWRLSAQHRVRQLNEQAKRLTYAEEELDRARTTLGEQSSTIRDSGRVLSGATFDGTNLQGVTIASASNAFQRASFEASDLEGATLQGGGAAFQRARFAKATLAKAKLIGGGSSFQEASFADADLTGAVLSGGGASFQRSTFENARLGKARLSGSFQMVNLSGAHFEGADLSALESLSLESCYFKEAPTYDAQTKFPAGFDPEAEQWRRVDE